MRRGGDDELNLLNPGPPSQQAWVSIPGRRRATPTSSPNSVVDQLFECLTALSNQLKSTVELSGSLQAQHAGAISALQLKVTSHETVVQTSQAQDQPQSLSPIIKSSTDPTLSESNMPAPSSSSTTTYCLSSSPSQSNSLTNADVKPVE